MFWFLHDSSVMTRRGIRHTFRNVDSLITGIALPVMIMLLFVVIFSGAITTGIQYVNYIVPGVILTCVSYGSSTTAMIVARDMNGGLFNRFRSLPMSQMSILVGHVNGSIVRNCISSFLVFGVALLLGFRPIANALEWLLAVGLLLLVISAMSWLAAIFGLIVKSVDAAAGITFGLMFLPYISSAFVPLDTLPSWIQTFAQHQPMTPIIDTLRELLMGSTPTAWLLAVLWALAILVVSYAGAGLLLHRRMRS